MSTERQVAANSANAQRSTGPRSDEGKVRSSSNSLQHGAYSRTRAITSGPFKEDPATVEAEIEELAATLRPGNALERRLAEQIAIGILRLRRLDRFDTELLSIEGRKVEIDGFEKGFSQWELDKAEAWNTRAHRVLEVVALPDGVAPHPFTTIERQDLIRYIRGTLPFCEEADTNVLQSDMNDDLSDEESFAAFLRMVDIVCGSQERLIKAMEDDVRASAMRAEYVRLERFNAAIDRYLHAKFDKVGDARSRVQGQLIKNHRLFINVQECNEIKALADLLRASIDEEKSRNEPNTHD